MFGVMVAACHRSGDGFNKVRNIGWNWRCAFLTLGPSVGLGHGTSSRSPWSPTTTRNHLAVLTLLEAFAGQDFRPRAIYRRGATDKFRRETFPCWWWLTCRNPLS